MSASDNEYHELVCLILGHAMVRDMRAIRCHPDILPVLSGLRLEWSEPSRNEELNRYEMFGKDEVGVERVVILYQMVDGDNGPTLAKYASARIYLGGDEPIDLVIEHTGHTSVEVQLSLKDSLRFCSP